jgi:hypothetical protein
MFDLSSVIAPVHEFFTLARAERTSRACSPQQRVRIQTYCDAAERRWRSARCLSEAAPAAMLLRDAVACYLAAAVSAGNSEPLGHEPSNSELAASMVALAPEPDRAGAVPSDDSRVRAAIEASDPLYFDRLSAEELARTRWALERAVAMLRGIEKRDTATIRMTRWGRRGAVVVCSCYAIFASIHAATAPRNVALGKPVTPSSVWYPAPAGETIVDDDLGTSFGVHTKIEESANVVIDLLDTYPIEEVRVHNRMDGWFDEGLPLVVELSTDRAKFVEIDRRDTHFDGHPPWIASANGALARYVRVRCAGKAYVALSEVEVMTKKNSDAGAKSTN